MAFSFGSLGIPSPALPLLEPLFAARSLELEARSRLRGKLPCAWNRREVDVLFRADAFSPQNRRALERSPALCCRIPAGPSTDFGELLGPRDDLERLARSDPAFLTLLAAHDASMSAPATPIVMGVINVTPDSFSDGGRLLDAAAALQHGLVLARAGAAVLDVGGESTRPGAEEVPLDRELERVLPVVERLARSTDAVISVDTTKSAVAEACLERGASIVNDVSAGRLDPRLFKLVAEHEAGIVLMHMQGNPRDMQRAPRYDDVVREVAAFLRERVASCLKAGIAPHRIAIDPGIGFGKRLEDNLELIRSLPELRSLGMPIVLGVSRKSFLGALSGEERAQARLIETLAATALGAALGADVHRVHDPEEARSALAVAQGLRGFPPSS